MILTKSQQREIDSMTEPVIRWLRAHAHPHVAIVINDCGVLVVEDLYFNPWTLPHDTANPGPCEGRPVVEPDFS